MKTLEERGTEAIFALCRKGDRDGVIRILDRYCVSPKLSKLSNVPVEFFADAVNELERAAGISIHSEEPMTLLEALIVTRFGRTKMSRVRDSIRRDALAILQTEGERLMAEAEARVPSPALTDVQVYSDEGPYQSSFRQKLWVRRTFSDGSTTKVLEDAACANQILYTFHAGKKAGAKESC